MAVREVKKDERDKIAHLYEGWEETLIWSCLQSEMGRAWTNSLERPTSALLMNGDFCFLAGSPEDEILEVIIKEVRKGQLIIVVREASWEAFITQVDKVSIEKSTRYAIKKEGDVFDREQLVANIERLPKTIKVEPIDTTMYHQVMQPISHQ